MDNTPIGQAALFLRADGTIMVAQGNVAIELHVTPRQLVELAAQLMQVALSLEQDTADLLRLAIGFLDPQQQLKLAELLVAESLMVRPSGITECGHHLRRLAGIQQPRGAVQ